VREEAAEQRLVDEVTGFADELTTLIADVVPGAQQDFAARVAEGASTLVIIEQQPAEGIALTVDGDPLLRLQASYRCTWDHVGEFLAVRRSTIAVLAHGTEEPLFRYDFDAECDGKVPAAHLNVHGHRDELVFALMGAGKQHRGKARASSMLRGRIPRLASFHFPVGGHRFRPSLEDVLEVVVREFGVDHTDSWELAVQRGRAAWREKQLRAAVRDDPRSAVEVLHRLGYTVTPPPAGHPARRDARVLAL